jgi:hypothetical protein
MGLLSLYLIPCLWRQYMDRTGYPHNGLFIDEIMNDFQVREKYFHVYHHEVYISFWL